MCGATLNVVFTLGMHIGIDNVNPGHSVIYHRHIRLYVNEIEFDPSHTDRCNFVI